MMARAPFRIRDAWCVLFILALSSAPILAQPPTVGIKAGASMATLVPGSSDYVFQTGFRADFTVGGFASLPLNQRFALQPEVLLARKGTTVGDNKADQQLVRTNYVEFPVLLDYRFPFSGSRMSSGRILAGPTLSVKLSEQAWRVTHDPLDRRQVEKVDGRFFRPFDLGLSLGTGALFRSGRALIGLDARFTQGLIDTSTDELYLDTISGYEGETLRSTSKNQAFSFTLSLGLAPKPSPSPPASRAADSAPAESERTRPLVDAPEAPRRSQRHQACYTQYVVVYALRTLGRESTRGHVVSPVAEWGGVDNDPKDCPLPPISGKKWNRVRKDYLRARATEGWNRVHTLIYATREEAEATRRQYIEDGVDGIGAYLGPCEPLSPPH